MSEVEEESSHLSLSPIRADTTNDTADQFADVSKSDHGGSFAGHTNTPTIKPAKTPLSEIDRLTEEEDNRTSRADTSRADTSRADTSYTENWEDYITPRSPHKTSQLSTHRSRESGRLSPMMETSVEIGTQPLTLPRFNEPLKLRKGRQFVDYESPVPTVVYVPHRSTTHGRYSNVSVQRNPDGRYVVIEQRPVHTQFTGTTKQTQRQDIFGHEGPWTKKKTPWSWSTKGEYIERATNKDFYEPYLPPIKSRYAKAESKVGSLDNYYHRPGGGAHRVPNFKLKWDAQAKIGSLPTSGRSDYSPVSSLKLPNISPRYGSKADTGSFTSVHYTPGGSVILKKQKYDVKSRIGSMDNLSYASYGGSVQIPKNRIKWKKESKVGSLDNVTHLPKTSNVQVFNEKLDWETSARINTLENVDHKPLKSKYRAPHFHQNWGKDATPRVNSLANVSHEPKRGNVHIHNEKLKWNAKPKIQSHWKMNYDYRNLFENDDLDHNFSEAGSVPFTV